MNIGEYRTDGSSVIYRRDASTCLLWADAESVSTDLMTDGAEYFTWRTMTPGEVSLWCAPCVPVGADKLLAAQLQSTTWQLRAETAEKALAEVREAVEKLPPYPHHEYCNGGNECDCEADGDNALRAKARQLLGLEPKP